MKYSPSMLRWLTLTILALAVVLQVLTPSRVVACHLCNMWTDGSSVAQGSSASDSKLTAASKTSYCLATQQTKVHARDFSSMSSVEAGADALAIQPDWRLNDIARHLESERADSFQQSFQGNQTDLLALHSRLNI